jgi:IS605 OrfB family transposase
MVYELEKKGGLSDRENKKVENIKKNNLGDKKFKENVRKKKEEIKSMVNHSINLFLENEKPKEIIVEDLTFRIKKSNKNNISKKGKHKLNQWIKGYIDERIKYKSSLYGIEITEINAAGTSQICGECGHFEGKRSDSDKFNCSRCENRGLSAHLNSAKAIKGRKYDNEIKLKMRPDIVFRILNARNKKRLLDNKLTGTTKAQENNKITDFDINNEIIQSECELS